MWEGLRQALSRLWHNAQKTAADRQASALRARFWAEVREGQEEAEANSHP